MKTMNYATGATLRETTVEDIVRAVAGCDPHTGVFVDAYGESVYIDDLPFDGTEYTYPTVEVTGADGFAYQWEWNDALAEWDITDMTAEDAAILTIAGFTAESGGMSGDDLPEDMYALRDRLDDMGANIDIDEVVRCLEVYWDVSYSDDEVA